MEVSNMENVNSVLRLYNEKKYLEILHYLKFLVKKELNESKLKESKFSINFLTLKTFIHAWKEGLLEIPLEFLDIFHPYTHGVFTSCIYENEGREQPLETYISRNLLKNENAIRELVKKMLIQMLKYGKEKIGDLSLSDLVELHKRRGTYWEKEGFRVIISNKIFYVEWEGIWFEARDAVNLESAIRMVRDGKAEVVHIPATFKKNIRYLLNNLLIKEVSKARWDMVYDRKATYRRTEGDYLSVLLHEARVSRIALFMALIEERLGNKIDWPLLFYSIMHDMIEGYLTDIIKPLKRKEDVEREYNALRNLVEEVPTLIRDYIIEHFKLFERLEDNGKTLSPEKKLSLKILKSADLLSCLPEIKCLQKTPTLVEQAARIFLELENVELTSSKIILACLEDYLFGRNKNKKEILNKESIKIAKLIKSKLPNGEIGDTRLFDYLKKLNAIDLFNEIKIILEILGIKVTSSI
jgi:5'-deoxynucleotidase YfbR-like HD superfamily hydrolase